MDKINKKSVINILYDTKKEKELEELEKIINQLSEYFIVLTNDRNINTPYRLFYKKYQRNIFKNCVTMYYTDENNYLTLTKKGVEGYIVFSVKDIVDIFLFCKEHWRDRING